MQALIPPLGRCGVPETMGRATRFPISPCIGLGLHCPLGRPRGGRLLPHHFNLTFNWGRYIFCCTCRELALKQAPPDFTGNPALRCPDFPLHLLAQEQRMTASRKYNEFTAPCFIAISITVCSAIIYRHKQYDHIGRIEWVSVRLERMKLRHWIPAGCTRSIFDLR